MIEKELERARHATALLDNPLMDEILLEMKNDFITQWVNSSSADNETRERLYLAVQTVDEFRDRLKIAVDNGTYTKALLKRREARDKRD